MSAPDTRLDVRLVPMTREQRDALADWTDDTDSGVPQTVAAWDAAPADPAEVLAAKLNAIDLSDAFRDQPWYVVAPFLLAALGCVSARETNEKPA